MGEFLVPDWLEKAGAYLTDRGTLIRIGTFAGGGLLVLIGVLILVRKQAGEVTAQVAKAVI